MSSGQINGPGATPVNHQLPDDKALDEAEGSKVIRLKNGRFKVGDSQGSVFNRTVRKLFMPKTYAREAAKATLRQQAAAFDSIEKASGKKFSSTPLQDRKITVAQYRDIKNPPPKTPDATTAPKSTNSPPKVSDNVSTSPKDANAAPRVPDNVATALKNKDVTPKELFYSLKDASGELHKDNQHSLRQLAGNGHFSDILPPKRTAIHVAGELKSEPGVIKDLPFHANTVGSNYIATQGPRTESASPGYQDYFYQMLVDQNTSTVVNLTNKNDVESSIPKSKATGRPIPGQQPKLSGQYWPDQGKTVRHGENNVKTTGWERGNDFDVITLQVGKQGTPGKEVKVFHFHGWPDHGTPDTPEKLEAFHRFSEAVEARGETGKTTVHCRAGVGRTGVFITLDQLKQEARNGSLTQENLLERATEIVWSGRQDRGKYFVQRDVQFEFIISEMRNELSQMAAGRSPTPDVSVPEESPIYGNISNIQSKSAPPLPPKTTKEPATTDSILSNWGSYNTPEKMIAAVNTMNNEADLEKFQTILQDAMDREDISSNDLKFYGEVVKATSYRLHHDLAPYIYVG